MRLRVVPCNLIPNHLFHFSRTDLVASAFHCLPVGSFRSATPSQFHSPIALCCSGSTVQGRHAPRTSLSLAPQYPHLSYSQRPCATIPHSCYGGGAAQTQIRQPTLPLFNDDGSMVPSSEKHWWRTRRNFCICISSGVQRFVGFISSR